MITADPTALRADQVHPANRWAPVEAVVWHYTAATSSPLPWLHSMACRVSWHFTVQANGDVIQHADLRVRCSHAGGQTSKLRGAGNVNGRTIGVEVVNPGPLHRIGNRWAWEDPTKRWRTWAGNVLPTEDPDRAWAMYSRAQQESIVLLALHLAREIPALRDPANHVGHADVDPGRKIDPGPAFPWEALRSNLRGDDLRRENDAHPLTR